MSYINDQYKNAISIIPYGGIGNKLFMISAIIANSYKYKLYPVFIPNSYKSSGTRLTEGDYITNILNKFYTLQVPEYCLNEINPLFFLHSLL